MVGVDTPNVDDYRDLKRPTHTELLWHGVLVLENLTNLPLLINRDFLLYAMPLRVKDAASMPVRAIAELV